MVLARPVHVQVLRRAIDLQIGQELAAPKILHRLPHGGSFIRGEEAGLEQRTCRPECCHFLRGHCGPGRHCGNTRGFSLLLFIHVAYITCVALQSGPAPVRSQMPKVLEYFIKIYN